MMDAMANSMVYLVILGNVFYIGNSEFGTTDTCQTDVFSAECSPKEVIVMTTAQYGRMQNGRCVKKDYGFIGCAADVLRMADVQCSGRHTCSIGVPHKTFDITAPCPEDLKSYFEAGYICVQVASASQEVCQSGYIKMEAKQGFLSSLVAQEAGCGTLLTPWILESLPGQTINLTLMDFTSATVGGYVTQKYGTSNELKWSSCRDLFVVKEEGQEETISNCFLRERESLIYASRTNSVEVYMLPATERGDQSQFILKYEATGCEDPKPPKYGWLKRKGNIAEVGCHDDSVTSWRLTCISEIWEGKEFTCTSVSGKETTPTAVGFFQLPDELSIMMVVAIALFIGLVILIMGVVYIKRRAGNRRRRRAPPSAEELVYSPACRELLQADHVVTLPRDPRKVKYDENEYALIWEVHRAEEATKMKECPKQCHHQCPTTQSHHTTTENPSTNIMTTTCNTTTETPKYFELDPLTKAHAPTCKYIHTMSCSNAST